MRKVIVCEGEHADIEVRVEISDDDSVRGWITQGGDHILFCQKQRDEMMAALGLLTFPGEDMEDEPE